MATQYIIVSNTGAIGGGKRVRVLLAQMRTPRGFDRPENITNNNKLFTAIQPDTRRFSYRLQFRETESDALYFSKADLESMRMNAAASSNKLKLQDPFGTVHDVIWMTLWDPETAMGSTVDGADGWFEQTVTFTRYN
jgi:hypothetical protein